MVIEDLISTGGSSLKAVEAIRNAGCEVIGMVAIFSYEFPVATKAFKDANVNLITLSNYSALITAALETGFIREDDVEPRRRQRGRIILFVSLNTLYQSQQESRGIPS